MEIIGVIAEYNPLHNGHLYHINKIRENYKNSLIVAILSSEFSERGELMVFNKFLRTKQALELGVDLVLSNPIYYSMNNASTFAYSNIYFLNKCNVTKIVCGAESDDPDLFKKMYKIESTPKFKEHLRKYLEQGQSFKSSYLKSFEDFKINFKSNDLLAYFYYQAIQKINKNIKLVTIKRIINNYKDKELNETNIQSATALRLSHDDIKKYVPSYVYKDYQKYGFRDINKLTDFIKYSALFNRNVREMNEGIENKLNEITYKNDYNQILDTLSSKRYSYAKINRYLISHLLNIPPAIEQINSNYIRVIGFNNKGKKLLSDLKKLVTIYTSIKNGINKEFDLEIKADKLLDIIYKENNLKQDIKGPIIHL